MSFNSFFRKNSNTLIFLLCVVIVTTVPVKSFPAGDFYRKYYSFEMAGTGYSTACDILQDTYRGLLLSLKHDGSTADLIADLLAVVSILLPCFYVPFVSLLNPRRLIAKMLLSACLVVSVIIFDFLVLFYREGLGGSFSSQSGAPGVSLTVFFLIMQGIFIAEVFYPFTRTAQEPPRV